MTDPIKAISVLLLSLPAREKNKLVRKYGGIVPFFDSISSRNLDSEDALRFKTENLDRLRQKAKAEIHRLKKLKAWMICLGDPLYPERLAQIPDVPIILFGRGVWGAHWKNFLSFIGPRQPSQYGLRIARWLAKDLVSEGLILVSGLARGIDVIGHEAAVSQKRPTIAVLGCGLRHVYPKEHMHLQESILEHGAIVTEQMLDEPPRKENFPKRNRIISGLSSGLLVIEGGEKSGVRITVQHALSQNREIYAVPGPIDSELSMVPNRLIADGAKVVLSTSDILEDYDIQHVPPRGSKDRSSLSKLEKNLLECLDIDNGLSAGDLAEKVNWPISRMLSCLTDLELKGYIEKQSDSRYVKIQV